MTNRRPYKNAVQVELTPEDCDKINGAMDIIRKYGGTISVNKFLRDAAKTKAKEVNDE
ncbi:hypothetical protein [Moritella viscosa]|uniref:Uncharacterized protein n=1 Tax=Moritella viscosa TaxID=80854 RepID=A0ABY1HFZ2_9GAMM|nr:hypothetical protein [Moritella viscosa]SGY91354.1 unnamed protein product [Moritella viscosa]SGZ17285.1 unnamed protein product [Moritella viscosa]SHO26225.1 unnamed protein product [Moritella viscosa]